MITRWSQGWVNRAALEKRSWCVLMASSAVEKFECRKACGSRTHWAAAELGCVSSKISSRYLGALRGAGPSRIKDSVTFFIFIFLLQYTYTELKIKIIFLNSYRAGEMAQWVKALGTKPNN